ncbi:hypothetical protein ACX1DX_01880 [Tessaracoccus sp. Y36]|uniref:hypothetical protein n=1 Tax=Tessaracoccus sp. ZS01 TaxID=1906324 RepID=UPI00096CFC67|nr:hypothetical protein [Tessaracoccus sp. ZS01]MCG6568355.1 hypothetical protein [Tessaracoccus sp. ZS01]OMG53322.1 hypothetical protein BJN44_12105 [Tessaracoccus sp. ZS01]
MSKPKRAELPGASELFRPTRQPREATPEAPPAEAQAAPAVQPVAELAADAAAPAPTGRVRHDHKITVYFSEDELLALEDANLDLRRTHGIRVDRGRIVRVAVAHAVADLAARGGASDLVAELRQQ